MACAWPHRTVETQVMLTNGDTSCASGLGSGDARGCSNNGVGNKVRARSRGFAVIWTHGQALNDGDAHAHHADRLILQHMARVVSHARGMRAAEVERTRLDAVSRAHSILPWARTSAPDATRSTCGQTSPAADAKADDGSAHLQLTPLPPRLLHPPAQLAVLRQQPARRHPIKPLRHSLRA